MAEETYVDLTILARADENRYLVFIDKKDLNTLVKFNEGLVVRHWDGDKPVVLEPYGDVAVRTREDASAENNLESLPSLTRLELDWNVVFDLQITS